MTVSTVRVLTHADAPALLLVRQESLELAPLAFAASLEDDRMVDVAAARGALSQPDVMSCFGAFVGDDLVGMCCVHRDAKRKLRHRATVWGMYVRDGARGRGFGAQLVDAAVAQARSWGVVQVHLCVSETAASAHRLYVRCGFRETGRTPRSLCWEGRYVDDIQMVRAID